MMQFVEIRQGKCRACSKDQAKPSSLWYLMPEPGCDDADENDNLKKCDTQRDQSHYEKTTQLSAALIIMTAVNVMPHADRRLHLL